MVKEDFQKGIKEVNTKLKRLFGLYVIIGSVFFSYMINPDLYDFKNKSQISEMVPVEIDEDLIKNGIHVRTGLIEAEGLMIVVNNCTNCHSAKLVTQNRMSTERWNATIRWMQETQNLWELGEYQEVIVNYLVTNYPVKDVGRRAVLTNIDWYELEN